MVVGLVGFGRFFRRRFVRRRRLVGELVRG
jgi:hypothetical protein